jgi:protein-L-isoaspartate O-methyltransferase
VVVDLGCGGGMDVFLAAPKVGATGRVIGIDMTAEMLERARSGQQKLGLNNIEFHQATIDRLPLPDNSVDCVISNCVINLVPDKLAVFGEILRVLKPGGRVALSDIALKQELPASVKQSVEAYVGCIAGAILIHEYRRLLEQAGFTSVVVSDTGSDLNAYAQASNSGCCGSSTNSTAMSCCGSEPKSLHDGLAEIMQNFDANAYAASVRVHAIKQLSSEPVNILPPLSIQSTKKVQTMKTIQVYDKPMCCSTGICGPEVDPVLPMFAADLDWLKSQGHQVERYNLAQQQAFIDNKTIHQLLSTTGTNCLPVIMIDGKVVSQTLYPSREELSGWLAGQHIKKFLPVAG